MKIFQTPEHHEYLVDFASGVLRLSFNRPEFGNAMRQTTVPHLAKLFRDAGRSEQVRSILIRGEGKNFSAGGDIAGFAPALEQEVSARQAQFSHRLANLRALVEAVLDFDRPLVVSIRGAAAGAGLLYPLAADFVIGDGTAIFVFAHQRIALCPDSGISALLPQAVGQRMARSLLLTSARVESEDALRLGLMNRVVEPEELESDASEIAYRLAQAPRRASILTKRLVNESPRRFLSEQLEAETKGIAACLGDRDFDEGVRAFLEKRDPSFPSAAGCSALDG